MLFYILHTTMLVYKVYRLKDNVTSELRLSGAEKGQKFTSHA